MFTVQIAAPALPVTVLPPGEQTKGKTYQEHFANGGFLPVLLEWDINRPWWFGAGIERGRFPFGVSKAYMANSKRGRVYSPYSALNKLRRTGKPITLLTDRPFAVPGIRNTVGRSLLQWLLLKAYNTPAEYGVWDADVNVEFSTWVFPAMDYTELYSKMLDLSKYEFTENGFNTFEDGLCSWKQALPTRRLQTPQNIEDTVKRTET